LFFPWIIPWSRLESHPCPLPNISPKKIAPHVSRPCAVVDGAHIFNPKAVENAGLIYRGIGRGVWSK